jgi:hypothetical protein
VLLCPRHKDASGTAAATAIAVDAPVIAGLRESAVMSVLQSEWCSTLSADTDSDEKEMGVTVAFQFFRLSLVDESPQNVCCFKGVFDFRNFSNFVPAALAIRIAGFSATLHPLP